MEGGSFAFNYVLILSFFVSLLSVRGPWGALSPIPENNAVAVDTQVDYSLCMSPPIYLACNYLHEKKLIFSCFPYTRGDPFFQLLVILVRIAGMWYVFVQGE